MKRHHASPSLAMRPTLTLLAALLLAPLVIEYVGRKDYKKLLPHMRNALREAGVTES